jgi:hypothetical protein
MSAKEVGITAAPHGSWVQTERSAHERLAKLAMSHPRATSVLHTLVSKMGRHNAVVASLPNLVKLTGASRNTLIRALTVLREQNWIEVRQIGASGTTNVYVVNDRVAWSGARDGIRYSLFSAAVLVSDDEQPDREELGAQAPLERVPALYPGEHQLPTGPGLPPPTQPSLTGLEPDLPTRALDD